ncbi:MAG: lipoprotein [Idiomarina sp.]|nr:lipoprotein [Idiomarina sp.]
MIKRTSLTALFLLICFGLTACGQKGPLYLPEPAETTEANEPSLPANHDNLDSES